MRVFIITLLLIAYSLFIPQGVFADYVLPYPSFMPGNKVYRLTRIIDRISGFWYFGNVAQAKFHLKLSDKYLVEAKTLFEYGQYLLGVDALSRSDREFSTLPEAVAEARNMRIDVSQLVDTIRAAEEKHTSVLTSVEGYVPAEFTWTPEKTSATHLKLRDMIEASKRVRTGVFGTIVGR